MKANAHRKRVAEWRTQKQRLLQERSLLRFRPGTRPLTSPREADETLYPSPPRKEDSLVTEGSDDEFASWLGNEANWSSLPLRQAAYSHCQSLLDSHIGGLRGDPFKMYPIESKGCVPSAIDYFAEVYAPLAIRAPEDPATRREDTIFPAYFRTLLHDAMFFEGIVVLSQMLQLLHQDARSRRSREIMTRSGNVLTQLNERLSPTSNGTSDVVILTIMAFTAICHLMRDVQAYNIHVHGLRRIVALRGGIDNLGWGGYLKARMVQIELIWTQKMQEQQQRKGRKGEVEEIPVQKLKYPNHPYSPNLCKVISTLPSGFSDLALSTKLSIQVIYFLSQSMAWAREQTEASATNGAQGAINILDESGSELATTERLIVTTFLAFYIFIDRKIRGAANPINEMRVVAHVRLLLQDDGVEECDRDFLSWAALMLCATTNSKTEPWQWARELLSATKVYDIRRKELEKAFLPIPE